MTTTLFILLLKCTKIDKIVHYDVLNARNLANARASRELADGSRGADGRDPARAIPAGSVRGENARRIHERDGETDTCLVCGDLCAVKMVNELFGTGGKKKGKKEIHEFFIFFYVGLIEGIEDALGAPPRRWGNPA